MVRARASAALGHSPQGQTLPLYVACEGVVYQAKFAGKRSGLSVRELVVEAFGTELGSAMGLETGIPAIVELPEIVAADIEARYAFGLTDAYGFATLFMPELSPFLPEDDGPYVPLDEAAALFALDTFLINGDRTLRNPNLAWLDGRLFVFDFEHALTLRNSPYPERMADHIRAARMIMGEHLLDGRIPRGWMIEPLANALYNVGVGTLTTMRPSLPDAWQPHWADLHGYVSYLRENADAFMAGIWEREP